MISFDTEYTGRESFYGQGAGRYPTAYNAVEDCVDIAGGVKSFYTDKMEPVSPDNGAEAHPYYIRSSADASAFAAEAWGEGVLTRPLSVKEAHDWAEKALKSDPGTFMAGIKD